MAPPLFVCPRMHTRVRGHERHSIKHYLRLTTTTRIRRGSSVPGRERPSGVSCVLKTRSLLSRDCFVPIDHL